MTGSSHAASYTAHCKFQRSGVPENIKLLLTAIFEAVSKVATTNRIIPVCDTWHSNGSAGLVAGCCVVVVSSADERPSRSQSYDRLSEQCAARFQVAQPLLSLAVPGTAARKS